MPNELWTEVHDIIQETRIKTIPKKKKCKKKKKIAEERREAKGKGQKEIYANLKAELQRIATRDSLLIARKPPQRSVQRYRGKQ